MGARTKNLVLSPTWPEPERPKRQVTVRLDAPPASEDDQPVRDVSAATRIGSDLFLGADEGAWLERLSLNGNGGWSDHVRFELADMLKIDEAHSGEVDIEGLAYDDGWLWIMGSHSRTRPKVDADDEGCIDLKKFADLKDTRPRCLLARVPIVSGEEGQFEPSPKDGIRRAGKLKQNKHGNALAEAIYDDPLLHPFHALPCKEGGLDLEGIAVAGNRIAIGCRGPVIGTYAVILETIVRAKSNGKLKLDRIPVKRLVDLGGLGIRDLKRHGDDLLILAGPATDLDGPVALYRWSGWLHDAGSDDDKVRLHRPERVLDLPFGCGNDHPEGLAVLETETGESEILLLVDGPSEERFDAKKRQIIADVFDLPPASR